MSRGEDEELRASTTAVEADVARETPSSNGRACAADARFPEFTDGNAAPALRGMWSEPDSRDVLVRGATYPQDHVKVAAGPSVGTLLHFDAWTTATPEARHHITRFDLKREGEQSVVRYCATHFPEALVFVLNIALPDASNVSLVSYWLVPGFATRHEEENDDDADGHGKFYRLLKQFVKDGEDGEASDESFRNARFKMIPSFTQAPWVLNQLVQSRPALTGRKLTQRYYRGPNYVEVAMDISSSTIAHYIGSLCQSWASYIEVDVFITVQGEEEDELPEKILGGVRLQYMDLALARRVDRDDDDQQEDY